jgi:hypothetical protein
MESMGPGIGEAFRSSVAACTTARLVKSALRFLVLAPGSWPSRSPPALLVHHFVTWVHSAQCRAHRCPGATALLSREACRRCFPKPEALDNQPNCDRRHTGGGRSHVVFLTSHTDCWTQSRGGGRLRKIIAVAVVVVVAAITTPWSASTSKPGIANKVEMAVGGGSAGPTHTLPLW